MKRVLIIGGSGYLASKLIPKLPNWKVDALDLLPGPRNYIEDYYQWDITQHIPLLGSYNVIIHLASVFSGPSINKVNYKGTLNVIKFSRGSRLIYISSCGVLNNTDRTDYTLSKTISEMAIMETLEDYSIIRMASIYGWAPIMNYSGIVNSLVRSAIQTGKVEIKGFNEYRPVIHVGDAVNIILSTLEGKTEVINAATENITKQQIVDCISKYIKIHVESSKSNNSGYEVQPLLPGSVFLDQGIKEMISNIRRNNA